MRRAPGDEAARRARALDARLDDIVRRSTHETSLMIAIHDAIARTGRALLWRNNVGRHGRVAFGLGLGSADLVGVVRGRFFALEVKTATGRLSPQQVAWARAVTANGGYVACVRSVDEALRALEEATK